MKHGSLFSGIGGFDLAAEWMGWDNVFHCEWNPFGQKVLKHYWPKATSYADITKTDFSIHRGTIDILTGGFPCQPYSQAGKRLGKEDDRHLWPEMLRAIREIQPSWIVGENVLGLVNWNGGLVFDEVQADLEAQGYEVQPFVLPACAVNAPHRRDRVWFVAHSNLRSDRNIRGQDREADSLPSNSGKEIHSRESTGTVAGVAADSQSDGDNKRGISYKGEDSTGKVRAKRTNKLHSLSIGNATDSDSSVRERGQGRRQTEKRGQPSNEQLRRCSQFHRTNWQEFPSQPPLCDGNDGISERLDGITFPKWRNESIKAGGNAIVPQVVYQIFKAIESYNQTA